MPDIIIKDRRIMSVPYYKSDKLIAEGRAKLVAPIQPKTKKKLAAEAADKDKEKDKQLTRKAKRKASKKSAAKKNSGKQAS